MHIDIKSVTIAHEFTLYKNQSTNYSEGRQVYGLCYVESGSVVYKLYSGEKYTYTAGDFFFLPPDIAYIAHALDDFKHFTVNFTADTASAPIFKKITAVKLATGRVPSLFKELCELYMYKRAGYSMRAVGYVYALVGEFIEAMYFEGMTSANRKKLQKAKEYIDKNYSKNITISELAKIANMSETHFRREFVKLFSSAPMQYRDEVRVFYAKAFLSSGFYNVGEVAAIVGIEDEGYFCRFFKKHTLLTPKQYIESV